MQKKIDLVEREKKKHLKHNTEFDSIAATTALTVSAKHYENIAFTNLLMNPWNKSM